MIHDMWLFGTPNDLWARGGLCLPSGVLHYLCSPKCGFLSTNEDEG